MNPRGKTIVVTGGGSGMGRELVLLLLARGAKVAAIDIDEGGLALVRQGRRPEPWSTVARSWR